MNKKGIIFNNSQKVAELLNVLFVIIARIKVLDNLIVVIALGKDLPNTVKPVKNSNEIIKVKHEIGVNKSFSQGYGQLIRFRVKS